MTQKTTTDREHEIHERLEQAQSAERDGALDTAASLYIRSTENGFHTQSRGLMPWKIWKTSGCTFMKYG
jgi:hypothetical protein